MGVRLLRVVSLHQIELSIPEDYKAYRVVTLSRGDVVVLMTEVPMRWRWWSTHLFLTKEGVGHHLTSFGNELRNMEFID